MSIGHKFRFTTLNQAVVALPITRAMLLNLYSMATTTTNQFRVLTAVKLKKLEVWVDPPALGSASTSVHVEWVGNQAPSTIHSDASMGVRPAHVLSKPPADSSDRWWSISGVNETETLFKITASAGSIIDVSMSLRYADDEAPVAAENGTGAGATVGHVYFNYLDGFASKLLVPTGGVTVLP